MGTKLSFQNITLKANAGYRFSDRVNIQADLQQVAQGRNAGDFLYEANTNFLLSNSVGRIVLGAYLLNRSPELMFERVNYQYYSWINNFDRPKTTNFSFFYENPKFRFSAKAEYFLLSKYLYYTSGALPKQVIPVQSGSDINLLKISVGKKFTFGKFNLDNYIVYQKTDNNAILRVPELYSYNSLYFSNRFFKVLYTSIGFDVRYNTAYPVSSYALDIMQFYNGTPVKYETYPLVDVWLKANLRRANLFLKYNYLNQGFPAKGYYTVNRYPMQDALLTFGVQWNFYD